MADNTRRTARHSVSLPALVTVDGETAEVTIHNLSLGGAYLEVGRRLAMGMRVHIAFRVPTHEDIIEIGAQVRWTTDDGVGVQFDGLRAREVWALNRYFGTF